MKANQLAAHFDGECLSATSEGTLSHISIVRGNQALKFKCKHGHAFYKFIDEFMGQSTAKLSLSNRKCSI